MENIDVEMSKAQFSKMKKTNKGLCVAHRMRQYKESNAVARKGCGLPPKVAAVKPAKK